MKGLSTTEQTHQQDLERLKLFRYMDDDFMTVCLEDNYEAVEIQRSDKGSGVKRARYITIGEEKVLFGDGSHILYVNGKYRGDDEVGKLMHDFSCTDPDDMNYEILAKKARYFKQDEKGRKRSGGPLLCADRNGV